MRSGLTPLVFAALTRAVSGQGGGGGGGGLAATELDAGPMATWARRDFYGVALSVARRPAGQGRLALVVAGGALDGDAAVRLEATAQFIVSPGAKRGISPYGGVGATYMGSRGRQGSGALVALVGVESAPGRRRGWFGEVGLGAGLRARMGVRWRHLPPWWS